MSPNRKVTDFFLIIILPILLVVRIMVSVTSKKSESGNSQWPDYLVSQASLFTKRPTNTTEAAELNWKKSDEPCVPSLGVPWLYNGEHRVNSSATLYFTPEIDDAPGSLSGIEVDYYGYIEENLIGSYFSEKRLSKDGTYHSIALALRNSETEDLCSASSSSVQPVNEKYLAISPDYANEQIPTNNSSPYLTNSWQEGSCIPTMGYHWVKDHEGGKVLTYKAENTVPIVPMYDPVDGELVAIFFLATDKKQNWADTCTFTSPECIAALNFWDPGPGLLQANEGRFYFCSNLCGKCQYTGSGSTPGIYTTMHWFFKDPHSIQCVDSDKGKAPYCRSGSYPKDFV